MKNRFYLVLFFLNAFAINIFFAMQNNQSLQSLKSSLKKPTFPSQELNDLLATSTSIGKELEDILEEINADNLKKDIRREKIIKAGRLSSERTKILIELSLKYTDTLKKMPL